MENNPQQPLFDTTKLKEHIKTLEQETESRIEWSKNPPPMTFNKVSVEDADTAYSGEGLRANFLKSHTPREYMDVTEGGLTEALKKELKRIPQHSVLDHIWSKEGWEQLDGAIKTLMKDYKTPSLYIAGCDPIGPEPTIIISKWDPESQQYIPQ